MLCTQSKNVSSQNANFICPIEYNEVGIVFCYITYDLFDYISFTIFILASFYLSFKKCNMYISFY